MSKVIIQNAEELINELIAKLEAKDTEILELKKKLSAQERYKRDRPMRIKSVHSTEAVRVSGAVGEGTPADPVRGVERYYKAGGRFIGEISDSEREGVREPYARR